MTPAQKKILVLGLTLVLLYCFWYFKLRKPPEKKNNPIPEKKPGFENKNSEPAKTEVKEKAE